MDSYLLKVIKNIQELKIQGATSIAKASVLALGTWTAKNKWSYEQLSSYAEKMAFARPTEPLTQNCVLWLLDKAKLKEGESLLSDANEIIMSLKIAKEKSIEIGISLIKNDSTVLTHCHSSSVTAILIKAKKLGKKFKVFLTETRPKYQGHITAEELIKERVNATMITDSQASFVVSKEDEIKIDLVIVGADAINTDGSAINKVGSYSLSLSAAFSKIPFYVAATLLKFTPLPIIIEERPHEEVWKKHPRGLKIINPAFDRIPNKFITGYITEVGLVKPSEIKKEVFKNYSWVFAKNQQGRIKKWLSTIKH